MFTRNAAGIFEGVFRVSMNQRKPFILNRTDNYRFSKRMPKDHIKIDRLLSVPVLVGDDLFGLIAVANSKDDYTENDVQSLQRVAELYALALKRIYAKSSQREADELLNLLVKNAKDMIASIDTDGKILFFVGPEEYGFPVSFIVGENVQDLDLHRTNPNIYKNIKKVIDKGIVVFDEEKGVIDDLVYWFQVNYYPVGTTTERSFPRD